MNYHFSFYISNILLGIGLAMDAFSVSLTNGLNDPYMRPRRIFGIAAVFSVFQGIMPLIGWLCVHTIVQYFQFFEILIPWIALGLLGFIGGKMLAEGIRGQDDGPSCKLLSLSALLIQGVATSIDALSVGFTIAEYDLNAALTAVLLIAAVTFLICLTGIVIGKKAGTKLAGKAGILGGIILIAIGLEIFISSFF